VVKRGRKPIDRGPQSEPLREVPEPPAELGEHGQAYWRTLAPQLIEIGVLTPLHMETFRVLCEQWQEYRRLAIWLDEDPDRMVFITQTGYMQETPYVRLRDKALAAMVRIWAKFGMTPQSLAQLGKHGGVGKKTQPAIAQFARKKYDE
jgi:P27 family predicted phage terminase small subunit